MSAEVAQRQQAAAPAGGRPGQAVTPRAGTGIPANLSVFSVLDLIGERMAALNSELAGLGEQLVPLDRTAESIDMAVTNVDEVSALYEAPIATRRATDAASSVAAHMADTSALVGQHIYSAQESNAAAFLALRTMRDVQDSQRVIGAGPRLLRTAGR